MNPLPRIHSGSIRQGALYPPCLHAGYTLVSGSSGRGMNYLPRTESSSTAQPHPKTHHGRPAHGAGRCCVSPGEIKGISLEGRKVPAGSDFTLFL